MPSLFKDFKVVNLHGDLIPNANENSEDVFEVPTKEQYNKWMVNIKKILTACGFSWTPTMALKLRFQDGEFLLIVYEDFQDLFDSLEFKYVTIQNAINAGAASSLPEPDDPQRDLYHGDHLDQNYKYVKESIATFSAQMSLRCIDCFPEIYGRLVEFSHPFEGLHEFAMLHRE